ncbi:hypothetical protein [Cutibacterium avidum]|uniref:hypothetical protein n=1 Tax=Cutibacterium avidum TaxID=33010 RepID=UPI002FF153CA
MSDEKTYVAQSREEFNEILKLADRAHAVVVAESVRRRVSTLTPYDTAAVDKANGALYVALTRLAACPMAFSSGEVVRVASGQEGEQ